MTRGLWDRETVAVLLLAAALPLFVTWVLDEGPMALARLAFFLVVAGIWHVIWMLARAQPPSLAGILTALALAMLAPRELGLVALLLSTSFGVVIAELAFGGWGRNVLNPATVAIAFMAFGYPVAPWPELAVPLQWAAWAAAALGLAFGVYPAGVLLGAGLAMAAAAWAGLGAVALSPAAWVVLVLLVADPVASAATSLGRWLNGALYGGLLALFGAQWDGAHPLQMAVAAALLASLAAPLFDEIALALWMRRRTRRDG